MAPNRDPPPHTDRSADTSGSPAPSNGSASGSGSQTQTQAQPQSQGQTQRATKLSKLEMPTFSGPLEPAAINAWLGRCDDAFFAWSAWNDASVMSPQLRIVLAGMKLEETSTSNWWSENRDTLKLLPSWDLFVTRFKDRFIPSGWRLDALAKFYSISQGNQDFQEFVTQLQGARNALASAGVGYTISDSVFKNHLLMFSNQLLQLRVRALPSLVYENTKVDALVNLMSTTWASLVAEGRVKITTPGSLKVACEMTRHSVATPANAYPLPDLTYAEREKLRAAGGCYHCRLKPGDPGWKDHQARNCLGDPNRGIPPRSSRSATNPVQTVASVLPLLHEGTSVSDGCETVGVVMPRPLRWSDLDDDSDDYLDTDDEDE